MNAFPSRPHTISLSYISSIIVQNTSNAGYGCASSFECKFPFTSVFIYYYYYDFDLSYELTHVHFVLNLHQASSGVAAGSSAAASAATAAAGTTVVAASAASTAT